MFHKAVKLSTVFIISSLALFAVSCNTPENYEGEPNIYCILATDISHPLIMIGKTVSIDDTIKINTDTIMDTFWFQDTFFLNPVVVYSWEGVSGVKTTLENSGRTYVFEEKKDSEGYYISDSTFTFTPGSIWKLDVKQSDGKQFTVQTRFPGAFEISGPTKDSVSVYKDTLSWTQSDGAKGYAAEYILWATYDLIDTVIQISDTASSYLIDSSQRYSFFPFAHFEGAVLDSMVFKISALDANAYDYIYYGLYGMWNPDINKDDYMHIEGAWGVFGSKTAVTSKRYFLKDTTYYPPPKR